MCNFPSNIGFKSPSSRCGYHGFINIASSLQSDVNLAGFSSFGLERYDDLNMDKSWSSDPVSARELVDPSTLCAQSGCAADQGVYIVRGTGGDDET